MEKAKKAGVRGGVQLDARLENYSAVTRLSPPITGVRSRVGNWSLYAAAVGSALATATNASANIFTAIYSGSGPNGGASVQPHSHLTSEKGLLLGFCATGPATANCLAPLGLFHRTVGGVVFDEINIRASGGFTALSASAVSPVRIFEASTNSQRARNFAHGERIGPGIGPAGSNLKIVASFFSGQNYGAFPIGQPGYLGFSADVGNGHVDYGWLKLEVSGSGQVPTTLEALAVGIETNPGESIDAGQTASATPEPGSWGLALLASGAIGVMALRKRRENQQTKKP